jgi:hypothetical protein
MRVLTLLAAAAAAHGLAPFTTRFGTVVGAVSLVVLAVLLALAASATPNAIAVASGALGAFASGVVSDTGPALAGALLVGLCFTERTLRVREPAARAVHIALAAGAGALAAWLSVRYVGADALVRSVVVVVAAVLTALPLLVPAEDPIAFALGQIAREVPEPASASLTAASELRASVDESLLERESATDARKAWKNLVRLAQARARLELPRGAAVAKARSEPVLRRLDQRISEHLESLTKMYTAADAASAATLSLDDRALQKVDSAGASLDEVSKAIVEEAL